MSRKRTPKSVKRACDVLWAQLVKARAAGRCERCGRSGRLEANHAYGRSNHRMRFEPRNGVALCHEHHRWAEHYPIIFTHWLEGNRTGDVAFLALEHQKGILKRTLDDYLEIEAGLKRELEDWQQAA